MKLGRFLLKSFKRRKHKKSAPKRTQLALVQKPQAPKVVERVVIDRHPLFTLSMLIRPNNEVKRAMEGFMLDQRSENTRRAYSKDLKRFIKFLLVREAHHGDEELSRTVVIAYKDWLKSEKLEDTSVDRHLATLRSLFHWFVEDEVMSKNPAESVRFIRPKRLSTTQGFTDEEVRKMLLTPDLHRKTGAMHYAILMVLFYCGLRRSELCELKMNSISEERGKKIIRLKGKGNSERLIPMIPAVWNALRYYAFITGRKIEGSGYLFSPLKNNRGHGLLQKPLDSSMIYYIVTDTAKRAGIQKRVSPHSCRATAISNARDHDVSDRAIQEFAGWTSPDMITRYDKRKTAIEDSAAFAIRYGTQQESVPEQK